MHNSIVSSVTQSSTLSSERSETERAFSPNGHYYALTCRHNPTYRPDGKRYSAEEKYHIYKAFIKRLWNLKNLIEVCEVNYEKKAGLHFHALIHFSKIPYFKRIRGDKLHLKWVPIYDLQGWRSYCRKEQYEAILAEQQAIEDYAKDNYLFTVRA